MEKKRLEKVYWFTNMDMKKKRIKMNINEGNPGKKGLKNVSIKAHQPLLDARIYIIYKYHDKLIVANLFFF